MSHKMINRTFEILLEQVEESIGSLNERGAGAFRFGDYEGARHLLGDAEGITYFRQKVKALQGEWQALFYNQNNALASDPDTASPAPRGLRTPEEKFRLPILESLIELNGSGSYEQVLELVEQKMEAVINDYDCESLPSDPKMLRWKNTAIWCRNTLLREELLMPDTQPGIWQISEPGREWVAEVNGETNGEVSDTTSGADMLDAADHPAADNPVTSQETPERQAVSPAATDTTLAAGEADGEDTSRPATLQRFS